MSTYVNDLRLEEIGTGERSGTWGTATNTNLELIGEALGFGTEAITTNADTHATTVADGSSDPGRAMFIKYTGTLDSTCTITIGPNTMSRVHIIENATSGSQSIIIKQGSGATVTIGSGAVKMVYLDGAGSGAAVTDALVDLDLTGTTTIAALTASGAITGTTATFTTTDNSTNLSLVCTDTDANVGPVLDLNRNVTGADDDNLGSITFTAKDDAGNAQTYAKIDTSIRDASNSSEASRLNFHVANNGSVTKFLGFIGQTASAGAEITFNEDSNDIDFRVESNGNANMINVDAANDRVGIGMVPDTTALTVNGQVGTTNGSNSAPTHSFYGDADTGMYRSGANALGFATGGTNALTLNSSQNATFVGAVNIGTGGGYYLIQDSSESLIRSESQPIILQTYASSAWNDRLTIANNGNATFSGTINSGAITSTGNITAYSDARLKSDVKTIEGGLEKVSQLRGVTYIRNDHEDVGVIAQEVEKIIPQIVKTADDEMGTKSVDYGRITAVLIESIKELKAEIDELKEKLNG